MGGIAVIFLLLFWMVCFGVALFLAGLILDVFGLGFVGIIALISGAVMAYVNKENIKNGKAGSNLSKYFLVCGTGFIMPMLLCISMGINMFICGKIAEKILNSGEDRISEEISGTEELSE